MNLEEIEQTLCAPSGGARTLLMEDGLEAAEAIRGFLGRHGHLVDHVTGFTKIGPDAMVGLAPNGSPVKVKPQDYGLAILDFQVNGRFDGAQVAAAMSRAGVPRIVGISSDRSFNSLIVQAGAQCSLHKVLDLLNVICGVSDMDPYGS